MKDNIKHELNKINYYNHQDIDLLIQSYRTNDPAELFILTRLKEKLPIRVQALIIHDKKLLVIKCFGKRLKDIFYTIAGGSIHLDETHEEALKRIA